MNSKQGSPGMAMESERSRQQRGLSKSPSHEAHGQPFLFGKFNESVSILDQTIDSKVTNG